MFGVLLENDHVVGHIHCSVLFHHRQVTNNMGKKGKRKWKRKRRGSLRRNHDKARHYMQLKNKYLTLKNSWIPDPENHIHPTLRIREKFLQIYLPYSEDQREVSTNLLQGHEPPLMQEPVFVRCPKTNGSTSDPSGIFTPSYSTLQRKEKKSSYSV